MQHYIRAGSFDGFSKALIDLGIQPRSVLDAAGLCDSLLDDPDRYIDFQSYLIAMTRATEMTGRDDFGLLACKYKSLDTLGVLGKVLGEAPTLDASMERIHHFLKFHTNGLGVTVSYVDEHYSRIDVHPYLTDFPGIEQAIDTSLCLLIYQIRKYVSANWAPCFVTLARKKPSHSDSFYKAYGYNITFSAQENSIFIPSSIFHFKLEDRDPKRFERFSDMVDYRLSDTPKRIQN